MHEPTCGTGIAEHASLPATISALLTSMADVLEHHLVALDPSGADAAAEHDAYTRLIGAHRDVAARLGSTAQEMSACRSLPAAPHRTDALATPLAAAVFARYVEAEKALLNLLESNVRSDQELLSQMRTAQEA